ncbi:hypothetical protein JTB14_028360 [Gonioctena quinquepunctata]|nr:hypothetical protein JTB14_028360 [Gonioctena quinquepunctata]
MERQSTLELINTNKNTVSPRQQEVKNTMEIVSVEQKKLPNGNESFCKFLRTKINFEDQTKIEEKTMDLFMVPLDYADSADMKMSKGIAVTFNKKLGRIEELVNQYTTAYHPNCNGLEKDIVVAWKKCCPCTRTLSKPTGMNFYPMLHLHTILPAKIKHNTRPSCWCTEENLSFQQRPI